MHKSYTMEPVQDQVSKLEAKRKILAAQMDSVFDAARSAELSRAAALGETLFASAACTKAKWTTVRTRSNISPFLVANPWAKGYLLSDYFSLSDRDTIVVLRFGCFNKLAGLGHRPCG